MVSTSRAQGKDLSVAELEEWFGKATGFGGQNTEDDLMERLVKGEYQQKGADIMAYCMSYKLFALRLPLTLMCMHFLNGMANPHLRQDCARTQQGQRWESLDAPLQFARGRDVALRAPVAMSNDENDMCDDGPSEPDVAGRIDAKLDVLLTLDSLQGRSLEVGRRDGQMPSRRDYYEEEHPPNDRGDMSFVPGLRCPKCKGFGHTANRCGNN
ncbi:hypothetical protein HaLaN_23604 [Haematococcus lacustris]|uniref:Uncharacterized protein n=1 Tax=Haematococcus lacustris TaxID=44745 RepID=A0A6A0A1S4_HAELA|nr:hypothetical protein HaLaN_23604 [Haematococcus lacustris]